MEPLKVTVLLLQMTLLEPLLVRLPTTVSTQAMELGTVRDLLLHHGLRTKVSFPVLIMKRLQCRRMKHSVFMMLQPRQ